MARWTAAAIALLATAWVVLLVATPGLPTAMAAVVYAAGSFICHQIPERSFHVGAFQMPVCARCFGLYGGGAAGSVVAALVAAPREGVLYGKMFRRWSRRTVLTALAALPTFVTFILEWGLGIRIGNETRAVAALPLGFMVAFVVASVLPLHYGECPPRRPSESGQLPTNI